MNNIDEDRRYDDRVDDDRRGNWSWLPLLLLPVAFYFGWIANDANRNSQSGAQSGVGGGPGVTISPTTKPSPTQGQSGNGITNENLTPTYSIPSPTTNP